MFDGRFDQEFTEPFATSLSDDCEVAALSETWPGALANLLALALLACSALPW